MRASQAISFLSELNPDEIVCIQWYERDDITPFGNTSEEEKVTKEEWELANEIISNWECMDFHNDLQEAIRLAKERLKGEKDERA